VATRGLELLEFRGPKRGGQAEQRTGPPGIATFGVEGGQEAQLEEATFGADRGAGALEALLGVAQEGVPSALSIQPIKAVAGDGASQAVDGLYDRRGLVGEGPPAIGAFGHGHSDAHPTGGVVGVGADARLRDPADRRQEAGEVQAQVGGDSAAIDRVLQLHDLGDGAPGPNEVTGLALEAEGQQRGPHPPLKQLEYLGLRHRDSACLVTAQTHNQMTPRIQTPDTSIIVAE